MHHLLDPETVDFSQSKTLALRPDSDLLVAYAWIEGKKLHVCKTTKGWDESLELIADTKDFKGDVGEVEFFYRKGEKEKRLALVGLGKKGDITEESLRRSYKALATQLKKRGVEKLSLIVPLRMDVPAVETAEALTEGILFGTYSFQEHKGKKEEHRLKKVCLISAEERLLNSSKESALRFQGVALSKNMINLNADVSTPIWLGEMAKEMAKREPHLKATVFDKKQIQKEKMGLLLAVNQGSPHQEPRFIILDYQGAPKVKTHTVLIGKGITYDTGGLNLKPTGSMETMKSDMSGAAIVLSTVYAAAKLKLKVNVTAIVPSTENAIGPDAFKPGDVYTSFSGKTVEIGNTDAEGRLVLADAISWVEKNMKPTRIIDVATLTGAIAIALGESCAGLFTPDDKLAADLLKASQKSGEKLWRMPLIEEYKEMLKSHVADTSNCGKREGGSITAALFLQLFVEKTPWAHLDIAGVAFTKYAQDLYPKHATGYGVRLLLTYLKDL